MSKREKMSKRKENHRPPLDVYIQNVDVHIVHEE